jgi:hypothetical protein
MIVEIKEQLHKNEGTSKKTGKPPRALVIKCDGCGDMFERKWLKETYDAPKHFCSPACHYSHRGGVGGYGADVIEAPCLTCGKTLRFRKVGGERKWGKTCSKTCYAMYRSKNPDLYAQNTSAMHTEESWQKIREDVRHRMSQTGWTPNFKGEHHTDETKARIREAKRLNPPVGEKNGMFGKKHTEESRVKMSEANSIGILSGNRKSYGKNGHVRGDYVSSKTRKIHHYRSSWELAAMKYLDKVDSVLRWDSECLRISYINVTKRWYVPDFFVEYTDGRKEIWEIKPKEFVDSRACQLKTEAAQKYCEKSAIDAYVILTRDDLKTRGIL